MSNNVKKTVGQKFLQLLEASSKNKDGLLNLACAVIKNSHTKRSLVERDLPQEDTAIKFQATVAQFHAKTGKDVSSDGMLLMIEKTYHEKKFGNAKKFNNDFKKKFPQEYGLEEKKQLVGNQANLSSLKNVANSY